MTFGCGKPFNVGDCCSPDGMLAVRFSACWGGLSVAIVTMRGWIGRCVSVGEFIFAVPH